MKGEEEEEQEKEERVTLPFRGTFEMSSDRRRSTVRFCPRLFATVLIIQRPRTRWRERIDRMRLNQCPESIHHLHQTIRDLGIIRGSDSMFPPRDGRMNIGYFWFYFGGNDG